MADEKHFEYLPDGVERSGSSGLVSALAENYSFLGFECAILENKVKIRIPGE